MMVALGLEQMLEYLGHRVVASAAGLEQAQHSARRDSIDLAILDVNLKGKRSYPVAEILAERGIPFMFSTGYDAARLPSPYRDAVVLQKPFGLDALRSAIESML